MPGGWYRVCPERSDHMSKSEVDKVIVNQKVKHLEARIKRLDLRRNAIGSYFRIMRRKVMLL